MRRERAEKGFMSLKWKIIIPLLWLTLFMLTAGQTGVFVLARRQMKRQSYKNCELQLAQAEKHIADKVKSFIETLYGIRGDQNFVNSLNHILFEEQQNMGLLLGDISSTLAYHKSTEPIISSLYLYTPRGSFSDMTVLGRKEFSFEESHWYDSLLNGVDSVIWGEPEKDPVFITERYVVPVMHRFQVTGSSMPIGLLANLDLSRLTDYIRSMEVKDAGYLVLVTKEGELLTDSLPDSLHWVLGEDGIRGKLSKEEEILSMCYGEQSVLAGYRLLPTAPWYILYVQPEASTLAALKEFSDLFLMISLTVAAIIVLCIMRIVSKVTKPLIHLSKLMEQAGSNRYCVTFEYKGNDEIRVLGESFNDMVGYTREYITKLQEEKEHVRIEQLLKRRAELIALQAQINPHFLYNTLDSIRWKAEEVEADEISQMVQSLATLFRIDLSRGQEVISIREEVLHMTSYLSIQRLRYGEGLSYQIDMDEELWERYVPKIILQPLVENSIDHGIREKGQKGNLYIRGKLESPGVVILEVEDDGCGIEPERLEMLQEKLKKGIVVNKEGYGIFNVNERLRLYFGEEYGLTIESVQGQQTKVRLRFPAITEEEVETIVPYLDRRR